MSWRVPLTSVSMPESDVQAVIGTLRSGWLTMGPRVQAFEAALAQYLGAVHVVAVSSGTAALQLACLAVGLGPGDEVIVPALTFVASASAVRNAGAQPVLCDVSDPAWPNLDPDQVAALIGPRTKAVMAVHLWGYPAETSALREICDAHGLSLLEDTAQAIGARLNAEGSRAGTAGRAGCFSFFSKNQLCVGEGGAVATDDEEVAARVRSLRSHAMTSVTWDRHRGYDQSYDVVDVGFNYRMDEPRATLGLARLSRLEREIEKRRRVARAYRERLREVDGVQLFFDDHAVERGSHFAFPVLVDPACRGEIRERMKEAGVQTTAYPAIHHLSEYRQGPDRSLPNAEAVADGHVCLPLSPSLTDSELGLVVESLEAALKSG
jgi:dTDP-4-amino-4,6-dideoxygalactose transaminase